MYKHLLEHDHVHTCMPKHSLISFINTNLSLYINTIVIFITPNLLEVFTLAVIKARPSTNTKKKSTTTLLYMVVQRNNYYIQLVWKEQAVLTIKEDSHELSFKLLNVLHTNSHIPDLTLNPLNKCACHMHYSVSLATQHETFWKCLYSMWHLNFSWGSRFSLLKNNNTNSVTHMLTNHLYCCILLAFCSLI